MVTLVLFLLSLLVVAGLFFLLASVVFGRGEEMAPAPPDSTPVELPDERPVRGGDVRALRLSMVLRGYRMGEVDWVLEQLARSLDERDARNAELERELAALRPPVAGAGGPEQEETVRQGTVRQAPVQQEAVFAGPLPPVVESREPSVG